MESGEDVKVPPPKPEHTEANLDDDKAPQEGHFVGATLQIDGDQPQREPEVEFAGPGFNRNRPGSTIGRTSVRSTTSRTSLKPSGFKTEKVSQTFFSYRENAVEKAAEQCQEALKLDIDGEIKGRWLLTLIDHWDNEHEKLVILCENTFVIFKYNFITLKMEAFKRVSLHIIDTIQIGDFQYPEYSIMPQVSSDRKHGGIQVKWNRGEVPTFGQRWNPFCNSIPWVTFAHHPLLYNPKENETTTYNVDDFYESLLQAVSNAYNRKRPGEKVTVIEGPIMIESYASLTSMVFNQSSLGFARDRNGLCY